jgi:hypothetical protein
MAASASVRWTIKRSRMGLKHTARPAVLLSLSRAFLIAKRLRQLSLDLAGDPAQ